MGANPTLKNFSSNPPFLKNWQIGQPPPLARRGEESMITNENGLGHIAKKTAVVKNTDNLKVQIDRGCQGYQLPALSLSQSGISRSAE